MSKENDLQRNAAKDLLLEALNRSGLKRPDGGWQVGFEPTDKMRQAKDGVWRQVVLIKLHTCPNDTLPKKTLARSLERAGLEVALGDGDNQTLFVIGDPTAKLAELTRSSAMETLLNTPTKADLFIRRFAETRESLRKKHSERDIAFNVICHALTAIGLKPVDGSGWSAGFLQYDRDVESIDVTNGDGQVGEALHRALKQTGFETLESGRPAEVQVFTDRRGSLQHCLAGLVHVDDHGVIDYRTADMQAFIRAARTGAEAYRPIESEHRYETRRKIAEQAAQSLQWIIDPRSKDAGGIRVTADKNGPETIIELPIHYIAQQDDAGIKVTKNPALDELNVVSNHGSQSSPVRIALARTLSMNGFDVVKLDQVPLHEIHLRHDSLHNDEARRIAELSLSSDGKHHSDASGIRRFGEDFQEHLLNERGRLALPRVRFVAGSGSNPVDPDTKIIAGPDSTSPDTGRAIHHGYINLDPDEAVKRRYETR